MVNVLATAQNITNDFTALGDWIGLCTGPPGATSTVLNEATGGSPAYARQQTTWTAGTNGSAAGSQVTLNVPAGTYPYAIQCSASSGNNMIDWCILPTPIMVTGQSAITFTPSASIS
jgi:hypothetical protein